MAVYDPKLLRVDLTTNAIKEEVIPEKIVRDFVGGRGFGVKYLYDELSPGIEPLSPANKLIFTIGPLAGTGAQSFSRWMVTTKSPLSGTYCRSVGGGDWGAWLQFAGLQMIIVEGKADKPVYLYIEDGHREIRDARELWGKGVAETEQKLKKINGARTRAVCIGPAGEKLVLYASVMCGDRAAGRSGVGTVMGYKNLKAIAIKTERKAKLSEELKALCKEHGERLSTKGRQLFKEVGTLMNVKIVNENGFFPTRNHREGRLEGWENINADAYGRIKVGSDACYACPIRCGKLHTVTEGPYAGAKSRKGPEYETVWAFTATIGSNDIGATIVANALCAELGLDTISAGNTIGFAYELFEKGIIGLKDTDGLELTYGNHQAAIELLKKIGRREGFGDILAEGTKRVAERYDRGSEDYAMHVKGLELPAYDPRGAKRMGLGYATSPMGGNHNIGYITQEIFGHHYPHPVDRLADEGSADLVIYSQDMNSTWEVGICCGFGQTRLPIFASMLALVTGIPELGSEEYICRVGERIFNLERVFNVREGFTRKDDTLPRRLTTEPIKNAGPTEGQVVRKLDVLLDEYYSLRGWDKNGIPTPDKLRGLGLEEVIKDIGG